MNNHLEGFLNVKSFLLFVRNLRVLSLEESDIIDNDGKWLHELAESASALEEFCGGSYSEQPEKYNAVSFPAKLCRLGLPSIGKNEFPIVFPFAALLKKLDLILCMLDNEDHCTLIQKCPNLEILMVNSRNLSSLKLVL